MPIERNSWMRTSLLVALALISAPSFAQTPPRTSVSVAPPDVKAPPADAIKSPSGLASKVIAPGAGGGHPSPTDIVTVQLTEWKTDGSMVDSTQLRGKAPQFVLNRAIPGMSEGIGLMFRERNGVSGFLNRGHTKVSANRRVCSYSTSSCFPCSIATRRPMLRRR